MNSKVWEPQEISIKDAIRMIANDLRASAEDNQVMGFGEGSSTGKARNGGIYIDTRFSRDPAKNANGGEYDFWTIVNLTPDGVLIYTDWSADWDYADWGGDAYLVPGLKRLWKLLQIAHKQSRKPKKAEASKRYPLDPEYLKAHGLGFLLDEVEA